ncbi:MAG: LPS export ABC transporter permease LptF, partial [Thermodesulfovibrionia bacterium]|nr:LPS export ABC transporter permease LptF [Thermodesulfovibrionia bacterium]
MTKLKTLNLYLFKELLGPFLVSLLTFSIIMLMGRTMKLADLFINKGLSILDVLSLLTYILIPFFVYIIPMSLLLTILLALGRLSSDGEIIAMKSSGISLYQIAFPIAVFSSIAFILTATLTLYAYPWGFKSLKNFAFKLAKTQSEVGIQERVFNDDFDGMIIYVDKMTVKGKKMQGVFISDKRDPTISTSIIAKEGHIKSDPESMLVSLRLLDGTFHRVGTDLQSYQMGNFNTYDFNLDLKAVLSDVKSGRKKYREMTVAELKEAIENSSLEENPKLNEIKVEYYKKFTIPFVCLVMVLLGIPLGIRNTRGGKSYGFVISLFVLLIYYLLLISAESLGK